MANFWEASSTPVNSKENFWESSSVPVNTEASSKPVGEGFADVMKTITAQDFASNAPLANQAQSLGGRLLDLPSQLINAPANFLQSIPGVSNLMGGKVAPTLPSPITTDMSKNMIKAGDAGRAKDVQNLANVIESPVETAKAIGNKLVTDPGGLAGEMVKGIAYDPITSLAPVPVVKPALKPIELATDAVMRGGGAAKVAAADIAKSKLTGPLAEAVEGYRVGKLGQYGYGESAYSPMSLGQLDALSPLERAKMEAGGNMLQNEGQGLKAFGEKFAQNQSKFGAGDVASSLTGGGLGFLAGGPLGAAAGAAAGKYVITPAVQTIIDKIVAGKKRAIAGVPGAVKEGPRVTIDPAVPAATGGLTATDVPAFRDVTVTPDEAFAAARRAEERQARQQIEQQVANELQQAQLAREIPAVVNRQSLPLSERARLSPFNQPKASVTVEAAPVGKISPEQSVQSLDPDMRAQIAQRAEQKKLEESDRMKSLLATPQADIPTVKPVVPTTIAGRPKTMEERLANLRANPPQQSQSLFEGMPEPELTRAELASMRQAQEAARGYQGVDLDKEITDLQLNQLRNRINQAMREGDRAKEAILERHFAEAVKAQELQVQGLKGFKVKNADGTYSRPDKPIMEMMVPGVNMPDTPGQYLSKESFQERLDNPLTRQLMKNDSGKISGQYTDNGRETTHTIEEVPASRGKKMTDMEVIQQKGQNDTEYARTTFSDTKEVEESVRIGEYTFKRIKNAPGLKGQDEYVIQNNTHMMGTRYGVDMNNPLGKELGIDNYKGIKKAVDDMLDSWNNETGK